MAHMAVAWALRQQVDSDNTVLMELVNNAITNNLGCLLLPGITPKSCELRGSKAIEAYQLDTDTSTTPSKSYSPADFDCQAPSPQIHRANHQPKGCPHPAIWSKVNSELEAFQLMLSGVGWCCDNKTTATPFKRAECLPGTF